MELNGCLARSAASDWRDQRRLIGEIKCMYLSTPETKRERAMTAAQISSVRDWSTLLPDIVVSVAERLHTADIVRLSAVCRRWAWILGRACRGCSRPPPYRASLVPFSGRIVPWLLLPNKKGEEADCCSFLPLKSHRRDSISLFPLPEMVGRRCVGSSPDGWMVTLDLALQPRILNPLTREEYPLPSLLTIALDFTPIFDSDGSVLEFVNYIWGMSYRVEDFRDQYVQKIVLTSAPPTGGIAVAIYGTKIASKSMALARLGDERWANIPSPPHLDDFQDVVYRREDQCLYAVTSSASVLIFHLSNPSSLVPIQVIKAETLTKHWATKLLWDNPLFASDANHLVFLGCALLQILRKFEFHFNHGDGEDEAHGRVETIDVKVMKHQSRKTHADDDSSEEWVPIRDLGDYSVFVGCNHAFAVHVDANDNDSIGDSIFGLRRNCIYFTNDDSVFGSFSNRKWHVPDVGVYDLEKKTIIHRFFSSDLNSNEFCCWPPPVWFFPTRLSFTLSYL